MPLPLAPDLLPGPVPRRRQDQPQRGGDRQPPYTPLLEWDDLRAVVTLNFGNFAYLFDDPLYLNAYLSSLRIAFISAVIALFVGYPIAYYIARSPEPRRSILLTLVILPFWTSFLLRVYAWQGFLRSNGVINNFLHLDRDHRPAAGDAADRTSRSISASSIPICRS